MHEERQQFYCTISPVTKLYCDCQMSCPNSNTLYNAFHINGAVPYQLPLIFSASAVVGRGLSENISDTFLYR